MKKTIITCTLMLCLQYAFTQVAYYKGEWTATNKQDLFTGLFKISKNAAGKVKVEIVWTYVSIDSSNNDLLEMYKGKKGKMAIEYAEGSFSAATNEFTFESKRTADPFAILGLDKYHLKLSANKQVVYGTTETEGSNEGMLYAVKLNSAAGKKNFLNAKAKVKKISIK